MCNSCNQKVLNVHRFESMSLDQIIDLYKQGYKLSSNTPEIKLDKLNKFNLMTSSCQVTSKAVGQVINLSATPSGGTPPYTVNINKDGNVLKQFLGVQANTAVTYSYNTTSADVGSHTFSAQAWDSCSGNPQATSLEQCTVTVSSTTPPPTSPPPPSTTYSCISGTCQPSNCAPGTAGCYTENTCGGTCATPPPSPFGQCVPPCLSTQVCVLGTCMEKKYITYGALGFGALFLLSILK